MSTTTPVRLSTAVNTVVTELAKRNPNRAATINHLNLRLAEISARKAFHQDPTPENLTAWCDAHELLEADK